VALAFVMAPGQNRFFAELVAALGDELDQLGIAWDVRASGAIVASFPQA
jgi:hypothetical protein